MSSLGSQIAGVVAPDFPEGLTWLNSNPLKLSNLKGKVVLIDFWTYSCINCQRTLPYLQKWWDNYQDCGLVIIGVHTPEFDFEKDVTNVNEALIKYKVTWPIVLDNNQIIWDAYSNHFWPAKYLINKDGKIVYSHFGEGNYLETELEIQNALREAGYKIKVSPTGNLDTEGAQLDQTPELYFGLSRGNILNIPQDISLQPNQIYTIGQFKQTEQYLEHNRQTSELDDLILLSYQAKSVYLVMSSATQGPIKAYITLDGIPLSSDNAGDNVEFDSEGRSFVTVWFPTLYNLVATPTFGDHILRISTLEAGLRYFAFTFGS